jgi:tetratricopeptide (TPR) repeat protein
MLPLGAKTSLGQCAGGRRGKPTGLRKWLYRLAALTLVPALVVGILEGALRVVGYGYSTDLFLDGTKIARGDVWIDNQDFNHWIVPSELDAVGRPIPFIFPQIKPEGSYRIFVLGESAAMGFPDPSLSFARILDVMLRSRYPDVRFEVVNVAMVAINSNVVLPIAQQCARRQPDLFVVHLGNNEVVGPFGAAKVLGPFSPSLGLVRANLAMKTTRSGQLLHRLVQRFAKGSQAPQFWDGMATFAKSHVAADDAHLETVYAHFRQNLQDICNAGVNAGIPVVVCTIPVNLKDSAPFGSAHGSHLDKEWIKAWDRAYQDGVRLERAKQFGAAIRSYLAAAPIDDQFADLAFRIGRCYLSLGRRNEARQYFERARDLDTLRFRSDSTINETIRAVVADREAAGIRLADAERAFARNSPQGIAGEELFLEHVHMNFRGNYLLARTVFECITEGALAGLKRFAVAMPAPLSEHQCADRLARTEWRELRTVNEMYMMLRSHPPFPSQLDFEERNERWKKMRETVQTRVNAGGIEHSVARYQKAIQDNPADWMVRINYADLLSELRMPQEAEKEYRAVLRILPHHLDARAKLGNLLLQDLRVDEARKCYQEMIRLSPDSMTGHFGLAEAFMAEGKNAEAQAIYEEQLRNGPNRLNALLASGGFFARTGKLEQASERFHEALQLTSSDPVLYLQLAHVDLGQKKVEEAIEHFEAVLRICPDWPGVGDQLAKLRDKR